MKKLISLSLAMLILITAAGCKDPDTDSLVHTAQTTASAATKATTTTTVATVDSILKQGVTELMNNPDLTDSLYKKALVRNGNAARIFRAMQKAEKGEPITVGYIGGSITGGAHASTINQAYATLVSNWWKYRFPKSRISFVNAGIGATGSMIGVHRVESDLLAKKPDFVVVEFAVNDGDDMMTQEYYESLVRRILESDHKPGVLLLFMIRQDGSTAQSIHQQIGKHYDLPMMSYGDAITAAMKAKKVVWEDITADDVHPNDRGHKLAASILIRYLEGLLKDMPQAEQAIAALPGALTDNRYMQARLLTNQEITPASIGGWEASTNAFWAFKNGWIAKAKNNPLIFKVKAKEIHIMFKKTNSGKGGRAKVFVDGMIVETLDSNFSKGWGEFAATYRILSEEKAAEHTVELTFIDEKADDSDGTEFALLGLMIS